MLKEHVKMRIYQCAAEYFQDGVLETYPDGRTGVSLTNISMTNDLSLRVLTNTLYRRSSITVTCRVPNVARLWIIHIARCVYSFGNIPQTGDATSMTAAEACCSFRSRTWRGETLHEQRMQTKIAIFTSVAPKYKCGKRTTPLTYQLINSETTHVLGI